MCGRYTIVTSAEAVESRFGVHMEKSSFRQTYNAAPTQLLPVISNQSPDELQYFQWGLIPFWAKDASIGNKLINARAETLTEKPSFRKSLEKKRCLVISDGFYEWKREGKTKQPYRITLKDEGLFALAGLWDIWRNEHGKTIRSFSIITTAPNELMKSIHDRMPVILSLSHEQEWLQPDVKVTDLLPLLQPYDAGQMRAYPVSTAVNSPANNQETLIASIEQPGRQK